MIDMSSLMKKNFEFRSIAIFFAIFSAAFFFYYEASAVGRFCFNNGADCAKEFFQRDGVDANNFKDVRNDYMTDGNPNVRKEPVYEQSSDDYSEYEVTGEVTVPDRKWFKTNKRASPSERGYCVEGSICLSRHLLRIKDLKIWTGRWREGNFGDQTVISFKIEGVNFRKWGVRRKDDPAASCFPQEEGADMAIVSSSAQTEKNVRMVYISEGRRARECFIYAMDSSGAMDSKIYFTLAEVAQRPPTIEFSGKILYYLVNPTVDGRAEKKLFLQWSAPTAASVRIRELSETQNNDIRNNLVGFIYLDPPTEETKQYTIEAINPSGTTTKTVTIKNPRNVYNPWYLERRYASSMYEHDTIRKSYEPIEDLTNRKAVVWDDFPPCSDKPNPFDAHLGLEQFLPAYRCTGEQKKCIDVLPAIGVVSNNLWAKNDRMLQDEYTDEYRAFPETSSRAFISNALKRRDAASYPLAMFQGIIPVPWSFQPPKRVFIEQSIRFGLGSSENDPGLPEKIRVVECREGVIDPQIGDTLFSWSDAGIWVDRREPIVEEGYGSSAPPIVGDGYEENSALPLTRDQEIARGNYHSFSNFQETVTVRDWAPSEGGPDWGVVFQDKEDERIEEDGGSPLVEEQARIVPCSQDTCKERSISRDSRELFVGEGSANSAAAKFQVDYALAMAQRYGITDMPYFDTKTRKQFAAPNAPEGESGTMPRQRAEELTPEERESILKRISSQRPAEGA